MAGRRARQQPQITRPRTAAPGPRGADGAVVLNLRRGPNDYILLRNGKEACALCARARNIGTSGPRWRRSERMRGLGA